MEKIARIGLRLVKDFEYRKKVFEEIIKRGYDPEKLYKEVEENLSKKGTGLFYAYMVFLQALLRYFIRLDEIRRAEEVFERHGAESEKERKEFEEYIRQRKIMNEAQFQDLILSIIAVSSKFMPIIDQLRTLKRMGMME